MIEFWDEIVLGHQHQRTDRLHQPKAHRESWEGDLNSLLFSKKHGIGPSLSTRLGRLSKCSPKDRVWE